MRGWERNARLKTTDSIHSLKRNYTQNDGTPMRSINDFLAK